MKGVKLYWLLFCVVSFFSGYTLKGMFSPLAPNDSKGRVTGIGGIFFKCKEPAKVREWYKQNLGLSVNQFGAVFEWYQGRDSTKKGFLQWSPFGEKTTYFAPSAKDFMINYRVEHLDALLSTLRQKGVTIIDTMQTVAYGKFIHIMDIEGNKIELWEPDDAAYEKMGIDMGAHTTK